MQGYLIWQDTHRLPNSSSFHELEAAVSGNWNWVVNTKWLTVVRSLSLILENAKQGTERRCSLFLNYHSKQTAFYSADSKLGPMVCKNPISTITLGDYIENNSLLDEDLSLHEYGQNKDSRKAFPFAEILTSVIQD